MPIGPGPPTTMPNPIALSSLGMSEDSQLQSHSQGSLPTAPPLPMAAPRASRPVTELAHTKNILKKPYADIRDRYVFGRELGRGQFGVIRLCIDKRTGEALACKLISKSKLINQRDVEDVRREVKIMEFLKGHPAIIGLKATIEDHKVLILSRKQTRSLHDRLHAKAISISSHCTKCTLWPQSKQFADHSWHHQHIRLDSVTGGDTWQLCFRSATW